jgi:hypothetical protein
MSNALKYSVIVISLFMAGFSLIKAFETKHHEIIAKAKDAQNVKITLTPADILILRTLTSQFSTTSTPEQKQKELDAITNLIGAFTAADVKKEGEGFTVAMDTLDSSLWHAISSLGSPSVILPFIIAIMTFLIKVEETRPRAGSDKN